jgi:hypothetical protein
VDLLVCFEFYEEGVERSEKVVYCCGVGGGGCCGTVVCVYVEDGRDREAEEEVVCRAAREFGGREVGKSGEVGSREVDRVEPIDTAFMAGGWSAQSE